MIEHFLYRRTPPINVAAAKVRFSSSYAAEWLQQDLYALLLAFQRTASDFLRTRIIRGWHGLADQHVFFGVDGIPLGSYGVSLDVSKMKGCKDDSFWDRHGEGCATKCRVRCTGRYHDESNCGLGLFDTVMFSSSSTPNSDPPDVLAGVLDEQIHAQQLVMTGGPDSEQQYTNVEEPQEEMEERVTSVTTLPLSVINDTQEQLPLAQNNTHIIISKVFYQGLDNTDTVLKSSDGVLFHVNFTILNDATNNAFGSTLQENVAHALAVDESSATLNIILHAVYNWPLRSTPALGILLDAVDRMPYYGLSMQQFIQPSTHIFSLISSMAVRHPVEIYALAAHHFLHPLAVLVSSHLLSCDLNTLTDPTIGRMGVLYYKRLAELHMTRVSALQNIVGIFPVTEHEDCTKDVDTAWALAALDVTRDGKPDYSPDRMIATMTVYAQYVPCERCQHTFLQLVSDAVAQWAAVPATI